MGQAAYDYNTARRRKAPQTQRKTALRVEKGGKRRLSPLVHRVHLPAGVSGVRMRRQSQSEADHPQTH